MLVQPIPTFVEMGHHITYKLTFQTSMIKYPITSQHHHDTKIILYTNTEYSFDIYYPINARYPHNTQCKVKGM